MQRVHFAADTGFFTTAKARVHEYFESTGKSPFANASMITKTIFWLALAASSWAAAVFVSNAAVALSAAAVLGFCLASIGFNISHDAIHGAYSKHAWVNRALGWTFQLMGASTFNWRTQHNVMHHTYTNIVGVDFDLDTGPWLRFRPDKPRRWFHRWQHVYCWPLYGLLSLAWLFIKDFVLLLEHRAITGKRAPAPAVLSVLATKAIHGLVFIAIPLVVAPWSLGEFIVGYLVMNAVTGVSLAVVFQLAHVVEGPRVVARDDAAGGEWAAHQVRSTANFAPDSSVALFMTGGLNHQIEHHLFPHICHVHYPALAKIVRETAREFRLPYYVNATFRAALASHARLLKRLGRSDDVGTIAPTTVAAV